MRFSCEVDGLVARGPDGSRDRQFVNKVAVIWVGPDVRLVELEDGLDRRRNWIRIMPDGIQLGMALEYDILRDRYSPQRNR